jgi:hypothetical protein
VGSIREALVRRHTVPPKVRRILARTGWAIAGIFSALWIAGGLVAAHEVGQAQRLMTIGSAPLIHNQVCSGEVNQACVTKAAEQMGMAVAWLPAPAGYRVRWLLVGATPQMPASHRLAYEELVSDSVWLELDTQPPMLFHNHDALVTAFHVDGMDVRAFRSRDQGAGPDSFQFIWTRGSTTYALSVTRLYFLDSTPLNPADYIDLVRSVAYAEPPSPAAA